MVTGEKDVTWVTVGEAAANEGVTPKTIYERIKRGEMPARKDGSRTLVGVTGGEKGKNRDTGGEIERKRLNEEVTRLNEDMSLLLTDMTRLREERDTFLREVSRLTDELIESRQRSDMIIASLTQQLAESRKALPKRPWWALLFRPAS